RLVLLDGRKEGKRGPAMIGSLWGEIGKAFVVHLRCQPEDVFCRATAPMQQNDGRGCLLKPGSNSADRLITMGIVHRLLLICVCAAQLGAAGVPPVRAAAQATVAA